MAGVKGTKLSAMSRDDFEAVRQETDPVMQAQRATELITLYQQRSTELARLRRDAINRAVETRGMTYSALAAQLGLSKGRVSQIRSSAPAPERGLFGVGPLTVAVPVRNLGGRSAGVIALEDSTAAQRLTTFLESLAFHVTQYGIPTDGLWTPPADAVAICGPKSSPITAQAIEADPYLSFAPDQNGQWILREKAGLTFTSPMDALDEDLDPNADIAYVARLPYGDSHLFVIAGVHAQGSIGAVDYLTAHARGVYDMVGEKPFSMIVGSRFTDGQTTTTEAIWGPRVHE